MNQYQALEDFLKISLPEIDQATELNCSIRIQKNFLPFKNKANLTNDERRQFRDGCNARDRLIRSNLKLIKKVARRYIDSGIEFRLILDFGMIGLITASETFDPDRINPKTGKPYKFSTHAVWQILNEMSIGVRNFLPIHIPNWILSELSKMKKIIKQLTLELDRKPTDPEILEKMPPVGKYQKPYSQKRLDFIRNAQCINNISSIDSLQNDEGNEYKTFDIPDSFNIWDELELEESLQELENRSKTKRSKTKRSKTKRSKTKRSKTKRSKKVVRDFSKDLPIGKQLGLAISIRLQERTKRSKRPKQTNLLRFEAIEQLSLNLETNSIVDMSQFNSDVRRYA
jgi:DNA-directed RNA polymerase specialized sigma subunit